MSTATQQRTAVSFIIPALNEARMLARLLDSISALIVPSTMTIEEVIVVDAESSDTTVDVAQEMDCKVISAARGSVARSRNLGAACADADILAFVDADCELPTNWLVAIDNALAIDGVVAVGSAMAPAQPGSTWVERAWYELAHKVPVDAELSEVRWLASFNLAVRKQKFDQVGGFNELLPTCEDVDLGYRLASVGRLLRLGDSLVIHNGESKSVGEFFRRESWRARGALAGLALHRKNLREILSFLLPIVVSGCMFFGILFASATQTRLFQLIGVMLIILPVAILVFRRQVNLNSFIPCCMLLAVYCVARTIGTFRPFPRVERMS